MADETLNEEIVKKKWEAYGNNYFWLKTNYDGAIYQLDGIMRELPTISMSTEWANSPAAELGDKLDGYLNNDMLQFIAAKNEGDNGGRMVAMDAMTSRVYKNCTPPSFDIKFRCYSGQKIGAYEMRNAQEWMYLLGLTTPIDSGCGFSVSNFIGQARGAGNGIKNFFESLSRKKDAKEEKTDDSDSKDMDAATMYERTAGTAMYNQPGITGEQVNKATAEIMAQRFLDNNPNAKELFDAVNSWKEPHEGRALQDKSYKTYGAHLFHLRIMPFVYAKPLTVYVSSWSVTPSREWNTTVDDHYYYDFTLSCHLDQIPSAKTWQNIFGINQAT